MQNWSAYVTADHPLVDHGLACLGAGEFSGPHSGFRDRRLRSHAVVFVSEGNGQYVDERGRRVEVTAPAVIQLFPHGGHGYSSPSGWTEHWMLFSGATTEALVSMGVLDRAEPVRALRDTPSGLRTSFAELRTLISSTDRFTQLAASAVAMRLLVAGAEAMADDDRSDPLVRAFIADAAMSLSVASRAIRLRVSVGELRARVRAATGLTPHGLIVATRISRAQGLLATTDVPVHAVARSVGYDDPAYFTRLFAEREGLPPGEFRAQHRRLPASDLSAGRAD